MSSVVEAHPPADAGAAGPDPEPAGPERFADLPLPVAGARVMLAQWERLEAHEGGARSGDDPEDLHKMRVASRRLRAAGKVFATAMERAAGTHFVATAGTDLRTVAAALGAVRDSDVAIEQVAGYQAQAPEADGTALERLLDGWRAGRDEARAALQRVLDGTAMERLRRHLVPLFRALAAPAPDSDIWDGKRIGRVAPRLVVKALRRVRRRRDDLLAPAPQDYHALRIAAKRLRYTAEFLEPALDGAAALIETATGIQDALGAVHDADVAEAVLLEAIERGAPDPARAADGGALARLIGDYRRRRAAALDDFRLRWHDLPRAGAVRRRHDGAVHRRHDDDLN